MRIWRRGGGGGLRSCLRLLLQKGRAARFGESTYYILVGVGGGGMMGRCGSAGYRVESTEART